MNQTPNYNFNVPVGSDVVNPLVQDFPNWSALDTILRNVANTGITTATHTKTGTIHTLTFSEESVPMIRFQATADFSTNDTFTVNGLSVSALTVAGESLPDGAFVIGSMVLCELRDNLLTVYTSASDAATLEGHPASYFATAADLQIVDNKADANKVLIDQINIDLSKFKYEEITTRDGNTDFANVNANFLNTGYVSVFKCGKQVTIHVEGVSTKSSADWIFSIASEYRPFATGGNVYFPYYLGNTLCRGYLEVSSGFLRFETLNTSDKLSVTITYNIA